MQGSHSPNRSEFLETWAFVYVRPCVCMLLPALEANCKVRQAERLRFHGGPPEKTILEIYI